MRKVVEPYEVQFVLLFEVQFVSLFEVQVVDCLKRKLASLALLYLVLCGDLLNSSVTKENISMMFNSKKDGLVLI